MTRKVKVGDIYVGGDAPVSVQTMYDRPLSAIEENFDVRMAKLKSMGCDIIRFSYPDIKEHDQLSYVVKHTPMPVVADIHFDYKNALDCIDCKVAALRINPGNIGDRWKTEEVIRKCKDHDVAVRIGLNSGSLPKNTSGADMATLMSDTALEYISWFENLGFYNTVVSLKASDPDAAYLAYTKFASQSDYPLHLGVTEAGGAVTSCVRSTIILSKLLEKKIGDTLRYSITGAIEDEVIAGTELLKSMGLRKKGARIVACPMCGRKSFNSQEFLAEVQNDILSCNKDICVAIMGCQVNGPGEAKGADIAVAGIGKKVYIYKNGEIYKEVASEEAREQLLKVISEYE
ncbi:MAG: flavodoxin-dependent (E)-4-hydroxy-3-methylbut-2-enyl-diphosphate synthase [Sphaerochaetaceae bacterium]|nr:flavodoxin-dependent (E)-4-hydroxy-3-methylbut-2-enyl-diphosphate synthase [Sphaerochaetaceae bacterium]